MSKISRILSDFLFDQLWEYEKKFKEALNELFWKLMEQENSL